MPSPSPPHTSHAEPSSSSASSSPVRSPPSIAAAASSIILPKHSHQHISSQPQRPPREQSPGPLSFSAASIASLPYRRSNPSLSSVFASTSSLPTSPPSSGSATPTASTVGRSAPVFSPGGANGRVASPATVSAVGPPHARIDLEPRNLFLRSFVPHVGVVASADTEELMREKGLEDGFLGLIRPFGERVPGKVTIRDSIGASRSWEDYGVRFTGLKDGLKPPRLSQDRQQQYGSRTSSESRQSSREGAGLDGRASLSCPRTGGDIEQIEAVVGKHLEYAERHVDTEEPDYLNRKETTRGSPRLTSPFYLLYLRRLLSGMPMSPHETFSHPVASVIAISSRNPKPIEELRRLYGSTYSGDLKLPQWVDNEYLRYYVLVHDEDEGDIQRSTILFDNMKRHFGLHCHLLRLRSSQCVPSDDDSVRLPMCEWISAAEEVDVIRKREAFDDDEDPIPCIFESDATALRTFVRELVAQSIVPSMERLAATWNDQVASRRRGLSGRFMSLSKRWTPFGGNRISSGVGGGNSSSGSGNYDSLQGFYRPDAPEAMMRKLADYAFMLRDFKLAHNTYELARGDFQSDKAWRHYAGANEMAALSALLIGGSSGSSTGGSGSSGGGGSSGQLKARPEGIDQLLETALYSYVTRCVAPYSALRTLASATELLRLRGPSSADDAARWARRAVEGRLVGRIGTALFTERVSACYAGRPGIGTLQWGARRRKAGFWAVLAAEEWMRLGMLIRAEQNLTEARAAYKDADCGVQSQKGGGDGEAAPDGAPTRQEEAFERTEQGFEGYLADLHHRFDEIRRAMRNYEVAQGGNEQDAQGRSVEDSHGDVLQVDEIDEVGGESLQDRRRHRRSLIGPAATPFGAIDPVPLAHTRGIDQQGDDTMGKGFE